RICMTAVRRLLIIVCAFAATMASAQTTKKPASPAPAPAPTIVTTNPASADVPVTDQAATVAVSADTDKDLSDPRALRLTLDDAIKTAMERNVGVQVQRYSYQMAGESLRSQYGLFDWLADSTLSHQSSETATSSSLQASAQRLTIADVGVGQVIPTGGDYRISWNNSRSASAGGFVIRNPTYSSNLGLQFNQPLLRNFGVDVTTRGITIARNTLGINREVFRAPLLA